MNTPAAQRATKIDPDGIYTDATLRLSLGLTGNATSRARREGRLRFSRQGRRVLYRGKWIIDWLEQDAHAQAAARGGGQ